MSQWKNRSSIVLRGLAAAGICLPLVGVLGGCAVEVRPEPVRVYGPPPPRVAYDAPPPADVQYQPAPAEVDTVYERDLSPYGHWVQTANYGRCWVPNDRPGDWRPYTVGHWVDTDQGWTWVAEGPEADWGVVTYHYGRWYQDSSYGWVWVPGTTWAPAWVAWRDGGGYCGWAPLPPQCGIGVNVSLGLVDRYCPADSFVFCDERYIGEPRVYDHFDRGGATIFSRTTNITNITYVNNRIVNRGVAVENVERRSGHAVQRVQLSEAADIADARRLKARGLPVHYSDTLIQHADQSNAARYQQQMAHSRAVDRTQDQNKASGLAHDRAVDRTQDDKKASGLAHDRAVDRSDADKKAAADAHQRAVDRGNAEKLNTGEAHDRAVQRTDTEKKTDSAAHDRAVQRTDTTKTDKTASHDRAVERTDAEKKTDATAHDRAVERTDAQKKTDAPAHDRAVERTDAQKKTDATAHERAVERNDAKKPEERKPEEKPEEHKPAQP